MEKEVDKQKMNVSQTQFQYELHNFTFKPDGNFVEMRSDKPESFNLFLSE